MIDIETLGTSADCTILSIAAIEFDRTTGELGKEYYQRINPCQQDRHVCTQTLKWWAKQPQSVFAEAMGGEITLPDALDSFASRMPKVGETLYWSQGTDFDFKILDHAFKQWNTQPPWKYFAKRDTRTLYDVAGFDPRTIPNEGTERFGLDEKQQEELHSRMSWKLVLLPPQ